MHVVTRGDAVKTLDPRVCASRLLGKVVAIKRRGDQIRLDSGLKKLFILLCVKSHPLGLWVSGAGRRLSFVLGGMASGLVRQP